MASFGEAKGRVNVRGAKIVYPASHKMGIKVPRGGSDCAKCEYVSGQDCKNEVFVKWNGSAVIPEAIDEYCCDMFETKKEKK